MKKVILNAPILDLDGTVIKNQTSRVAVDTSGNVLKDSQGQPIRETLPVLFGKIVLDALLRTNTATDAETEKKFAFANVLNDGLKLTVPKVTEVDDDEFKIIEAAMLRQPLIIKARFLEMVDLNNPTV